MATLYERVNKYADSKKKTYLTKEQRCELGKIVIEVYFQEKHKKTPVHYQNFTSEEGSVRVISYPKSFAPTIDKLIKEYYKTVPESVPKQRKRIPISSPKPAYSTRKNK